MADLEKRLQDLTAQVESRHNRPPTPSGGTLISDSRTPESRSPPPKESKAIPRPWKVPGTKSGFGSIFASDFHANQPGVEESPGRSSNSPVRPRRTSVQSQQGWDKGLGWIFPVAPEHVGDRMPSLDPPVEDEAERLLTEYREYMEPLFPFVVIPRAMSSDQLRKEKPFVWKAVVMQALYTDPSRQVPLGNELLNEIVTACFLKPRKCLDLLQALEVLIAW